MPRLRDRRVLDEGVIDMPMIWQSDAFALATGYDAAAGRYVGLWTPDDKGVAPAPTNSLLLVRPDVATSQRQSEAAESSNERNGETSARESATTSAPRVDIVYPNAKLRYFGVKTLSRGKIAMDFKSIAEEVIAHLRADANTQLVFRIEIEATDAGGFDEGKVRTVS